MAGLGSRTAAEWPWQGRVLCVVCALVSFLTAPLTGVLATAALGWTGTPGLLTAVSCHERATGKGVTTSCYSTFVPDDRHVLPEAVSVDWPRGTEGATKHVRTTVLGVHQKEDALDAVLLLAVTASLVALGTVALRTLRPPPIRAGSGPAARRRR
ncbi:hypothetical protein ACFW2T_20875 [Streptomyces sp. NPDC058892]|uniref:hypothetical protein n=1 Tax=unclassified Streptomyces TaxID=2593676 RepID=UPI003691758C